VKHGRYRVSGKRRYRNHEPGAIFEARLEPDAERRAIARGSIELIEYIDIVPGSHRIPEGWPSQTANTVEAPVGASRA
jgi:hypothetical protein